MLKKLLLFMVLAIIVVAGAMLFVRFLSGDEDTWLCENNRWVKHGSPRKEAPLNGCGEDVVINFSKTGNITNFDAKTQKETQSWRFLYEEPGAPAISVLFLPASQCQYYEKEGGEMKNCSDFVFSNGQRINVEGNTDGNILKAVKIINISTE